MKIVLKNGVELNPYVVTGGLKTIYGVQRDTLNFFFPAETSMEDMDTAFSEAACENITIVGDDGIEAIHKGYTVRAGLAKTSVVVAEATPDTEAVYENRVIVSMSQRTYTETKLDEQQAVLNALLTGEG